jgi:hypothetical protein
MNHTAVSDSIAADAEMLLLWQFLCASGCFESDADFCGHEIQVGIYHDLDPLSWSPASSYSLHGRKPIFTLKRKTQNATEISRAQD